MNNSLTYAFFSVFIFFTLNINAQEDIKVVKIDNSNFPNIEILIRVNKEIDPNDIIVYDNTTKVESVKDSIESDEEIKGRSVMFITEQSSKESIKNSIINAITRFSISDNLNLGFILRGDTTKNIIHYSSPVFDNNHDFFINILDKDLFKTINYRENKRLCKNNEIIENNLFDNENQFVNKAVIFICEDLEIKPKSCTKLLEQEKIPTYIILTQKISEEKQAGLIKLCTNSGGIFTIIEEADLSGKLSFYLEDISLNAGQKRSELYRLTFKTDQKKDKNNFKLEYNGSSKNYIFTKPQIIILSQIELYLIILSSVLLVLVFYFIFRRRTRRFKKRNQTVVQKSVINPQSSKPIEINVKTEGFNKTYFFEKPLIRIGRSSTNDIIIPDRTVSGTHAIINKEGDQYMVQDAGSTNGVLLNQKKIKKNVLKSKDKIKMGAAILIVYF